MRHDSHLIRAWSRREWQLGLAATASALFYGGCEKFLDKIRNRPVRRNVESAAAADDIATYKDAVNQMRALPATDGRNWTRQAEIHNSFCPHGNWFFLPWHRVYLWFFEEICRELTGKPKFALPYWNWTLNPKIPAPFWGMGNPLQHPRTATSASSANNGMVGASALATILGEPDFQLFGSLQASAPRGGTGGGYGALEQRPHNHIHGFVGGEMGSYQSPRDPVFWAHHNMIELCWVDWNIYRGNANTNDTSWLNWEFTEFFGRTGAPAKMTIGASMLLPLISYQYDADVAGVAKAPVADEAEHERLSKLVREGAPSRIEFAARLASPKAARITTAKPEGFRMAMDTAALRPVLTARGRQKLLLTLDDITPPASETDFFVRVFLGKTPPPSNDINQPGYAGSFAFFGGAHEGHAAGAAPKRLKYVVDVSEAARRLEAAGVAAADTQVFLIPVPLEGRELKTREFDFGKLELGITR